MAAIHADDPVESGKIATLRHSMTDFIPYFLIFQAIKMNKIVCAACGDLYISPKCSRIGHNNEFSTKSILHFYRKLRIIIPS